MTQKKRRGKVDTRTVDKVKQADLGEELEAGLAIHVQIPVEGPPPACEGKEGQRHWDGHINTHHAHLNLQHQAPFRFSRVSKETGVHILHMLSRAACMIRVICTCVWCWTAHLILELARGRSRSGEERCAIPMLVAIDDANGFIQCFSLTTKATAQHIIDH